VFSTLFILAKAKADAAKPSDDERKAAAAEGETLNSTIRNQ
jgi:hypothetical protein